MNIAGFSHFDGGGGPENLGGMASIYRGKRQSTGCIVRPSKLQQGSGSTVANFLGSAKYIFWGVHLIKFVYGPNEHNKDNINN